MQRTFNLAAAVAATFALTASAAAPASTVTSCGVNNLCPSSAPCCSQYGECGVGAYCLGGCDPRYSHDLQSCLAAPVCQNADYALDSLDDVMANTEYLGNDSSVNWVSSGTPVVYENNSILLTMAPNTVGTLLMSTHYVWYGKISATLSTSQGAGVVTAFIMMSDVHDEIDFEFVGVDMTHAQSNYYFQGITDFGTTDNEQNLTVSSDTRQNMHEYTIDWQPDALTWYVDGTPLRTKFRNETYNTTTMQYHYPQSPARVELSLWPAGLQTNGQGTVDWAGGLVDWNSQYMANGYYYAKFSQVTVECYNPPSGFSNNFGSNAYYYTSTYGTNDTVAIGNNDTTISSLYATGDDPSINPSASASASGSSATASNIQTVPGVSGGGNAGNSGGSGSSNSGGSSGTNSGSGSQSSSSSGGSTQFQQGGGSSGTSQAPKVVAGSAVALLGFFVACLLL